MKFAHAFAVGLMAVVAVGGVTEAQAGRRGPPPVFPVWFDLDKTTNPYQPGYSTGSYTGGKVQFGTCLNLAGVQQAGDADGDGNCLPAQSLAGAVKGYVDPVEASCTYTATTYWSNWTKTTNSWTKDGECRRGRGR